MRESNSPTVWVNQNVLDLIDYYFHRDSPMETGGLLLGHWSIDGSEVCISVGTGPGPNSRCSPVSYEPDYHYDVNEIARIYETSGRVTTYIGDWHTHPKAAPLMSRTDKATLRTISGHEPSRLPYPIMFIAGIRPGVQSPYISAYGLQLRKFFGLTLSFRRELKVVTYNDR